MLDKAPLKTHQGVALALQKYCSQYRTEKVARYFFDDACQTYQAMIREIEFRQGILARDLETYLSIRTKSIGIMPMLSLTESIYRVSGSQTNPLMEMKELAVVVGLQNDLLGFDKDLEKGEIMNAIRIQKEQLSKSANASKSEWASVIQEICSRRNQSVLKMEKIYRSVLQAGETCETERALFFEAILLFVERHITYCTSARRYHVDFQQLRR